MAHNDNIDLQHSPDTAIAEVLDLIRLMLEDSPYPVSAEDFPRATQTQPVARKRRKA